MKIFRINLYLNFFYYLSSIFKNPSNYKKKIVYEIKKNSNKKFFEFSSQLRVGFLILLKYLKKNNPEKNEIIFSSYNLEEMIEIAKNLKFKIKFVDIDVKTGCLNRKKFINAVNKKTLALVYTNMFNDFKSQSIIKDLCKKKRITFIEDNAIYFDNYYLKKNKKIYSGSLGDYSLYSFNIMKNISALYGGGISTNDINFVNFNKSFQSSFKNFPLNTYIKQNFIYLILKIFSLKLFYNFFFFYVVKYAHKYQNKKFLQLFYPSLKFKIRKRIPFIYFTKMTSFSKKLVYMQLSDKLRRKKNHFVRKKNNQYYLRKLKMMKIKEVKFFNVKDFNYQNFLDFPILVEKKNLLNDYLLKNGYETKFLNYKNCAKTFKIDTLQNINAELYEQSLLCLPSHNKIEKSYIDKILRVIQDFYLKNEYYKKSRNRR